MLRHKVEWAILSSYQSTIFVHRNKRNATLTISRIYDWEKDNVLAATFAWLISAVYPSLIDSKFVMPRPNATCQTSFRQFLDGKITGFAPKPYSGVNHKYATPQRGDVVISYDITLTSLSRYAIGYLKEIAKSQPKKDTAKGQGE
jgi:hypothetical protein